MKVRIGVRVDDREMVVQQLKSDIEEGGCFNRQNGVSAKVLPQPSRHAFPGSDIIVFVFEFATAVSASLIANWLYGKLKSKGATLIIGRKEIRIDNVEKLRHIIIKATVKEDHDK